LWGDFESWELGVESWILLRSMSYEGLENYLGQVMDGRQEGNWERPTSNFELPTLNILILFHVE
jgi:hypothetical protein